MSFWSPEVVKALLWNFTANQMTRCGSIHICTERYTDIPGRPSKLSWSLCSCSILSVPSFIFLPGGYSIVHMNIFVQKLNEFILHKLWSNPFFAKERIHTDEAFPQQVYDTYESNHLDKIVSVRHCCCDIETLFVTSPVVIRLRITFVQKMIQSF